MDEAVPLITNDAVVIGILLIILAGIFWTQGMDRFRRFYTFCPGLLLCYFIPSLLASAGLISGDSSKLYFVSSRYLLPASLVLLTLSIDLKRILALGPKAMIMFITGTFGIVIGGPLAILIVSTFSPETVGGVGPDAIWRGMATLAGSWIGGGANQTAMKEVFNVSDDVFSALIAVDVFIAGIWMAVLLYGAGISKRLDRAFKADSTAIDELKLTVENFQRRVARVATTTDLMIIAAIGLGVTAASHFFADIIGPAIESGFPGLAKFSLTKKFFWLIVLATTGGLLLSFTKLRNFEGAGASKVGSVFLYVLVASIGMKMDVTAIVERPDLFMVGFIWIGIHVALLLTMGKVIKAPFFFTAVGSQANIGGAASAPVVASAFHPALAPVGVMLAVLGYALGTYCAWICGILMQTVAP